MRRGDVVKRQRRRRCWPCWPRCPHGLYFCAGPFTFLPNPPSLQQGNFVNSLVILLLLAMVGATGDVTPYQAEVTWRVQVRQGWEAARKLHGSCGEGGGQAEVTWWVQVRGSAVAHVPATFLLQFGVGAVICFCVMLYRWVYLEESEVRCALHAMPAVRSACQRRWRRACCACRCRCPSRALPACA